MSKLLLILANRYAPLGLAALDTAIDHITRAALAKVLSLPVTTGSEAQLILPLAGAVSPSGRTRKRKPSAEPVSGFMADSSSAMTAGPSSSLTSETVAP